MARQKGRRRNEMSKWITDRLPTFGESDGINRVWVTDNYGEVQIWHYKKVEVGQAWMPTNMPEPYVKPDPQRFTVRWDVRDKAWALFDWDLRACYLCGLPVEAVEAAQEIANIYNKVLPSWL
jgi:hypothetical protein